MFTFLMNELSHKRKNAYHFVFVGNRIRESNKGIDGKLVQR